MTIQPLKINIHARGFTLIEILIAIFILGLVLATVYASYSGILKTSHQMEEEGNIYKMARTSMDRMIKDLSSLQTTSLPTSGLSTSGSFDLRAEKQTLSKREFYSLYFWSASHLAFGENEGEGRPAAISYYVQEDNGGGKFSLWRSDTAGSKPDKEKNTGGGFVICQNIDSLSLRFYDSTGREFESWDSSSFSEEQKGKAPAAVKIELALVNLNDKEKPYKFMTKVFLPVKK
jgi:general secretion pathway protein J